ncbi:FAD binding domain protein [Penicillium longicatenatum]|uniref:FAD binding domain protein n=1 Tax=Penicillium longicatenatum TaxID=1561947 RepID=UPI00254763DD|nr:FAD binding domain protein [Penicillium longicatenatum]KAJ5631142.1 FAD binding domain protein [Penicillium longicatenatum]
MVLLLPILLCSTLLSTTAFANSKCKATPNDSTWPSIQDWETLNQTIRGALIKTAPAPSSCYEGNPFNSSTNCSDVTKYWPYATYHSAWPESVDYSIFTNNSCLPPGAEGYTKDRGCSIGALPQYIVNATTDQQVATALRWATERNIRIVVKGTGHDLSGRYYTPYNFTLALVFTNSGTRSTGAYSLSIWTHNFKHVEHQPKWLLPDGSGTADVVICGSGNTWGSVYNAVHAMNRSVVGGEDATVGLGGLIQNGGHGLLSSHYGLASDQVYQVTVITADGRRLVANHKHNVDIFWAVRGAGGGQFGVITEFVLKTHPVPTNVITGGFYFYQESSSKSENISWGALAKIASLIPDLMDDGMTGTVIAMSGSSMTTLTGLNHSSPGVAASVGLVGFNTTTEAMDRKVQKMISSFANVSSENVLKVVNQTSEAYGYWAYTKPNFLSSASCGSSSLMSSRLLGRRELSDISMTDLAIYLRQASTSQSGTGSMLLFGLQGGHGPANTPQKMRGSVLPAWRSAYLHAMSYGASLNATADSREQLASGARWYEANLEPVWRNWAPRTGSYMNEGNAFSSTWKQDFYGENYDQLLKLKRKYDPSGSFFVWSGVGSDMWEYDIHSGLLCQVGGD